LEQLDEANVITELGGKIHYDHNIWLHNRQVRYCSGLYAKTRGVCCVWSRACVCWTAIHLLIWLPFTRSILTRST